MNAISDQLPTSRKALYALPIIPIWILHTPALALMPAIYIKYAGINMTLMGIIVIVTRCIDGLADPIVGYYSDRTRSRLGSRRPWILAGGILSAISAYFWFQPSPDTGPFYFFLTSLGVYLGWTLLEIPHAAWLPELVKDYDERSKLSAFRSAGQFIGQALFYCVPFLPLFATTDITPDVFGFIAYFLPVLIIASVLPVVVTLKSPYPRYIDDKNISHLYRNIRLNRPFMLFLGGISLASIASGMVAGLYFFFMDSYLEIGDKIVHVALSVTVISILSIKVWSWVLLRFNKNQAWSWSVAGSLLSLIVMLFITPGPNAFYQIFFVFSLSAMAASGTFICPNTILADIVDYGTLKSGQNNSGSYYALYSLSTKIGLAFGAGLALAMAGLFKFDISSTPQEIEKSAFFVIFLGVPILLYLLSYIFIFSFPLTRRKQAIIRRKLDKRMLSSETTNLHKTSGNMLNTKR